MCSNRPSTPSGEQDSPDWDLFFNLEGGEDSGVDFLPFIATAPPQTGETTAGTSVDADSAPNTNANSAKPCNATVSLEETLRPSEFDIDETLFMSEEEFRRMLAIETLNLDGGLARTQISEFGAATEGVFTDMYPIEGLPVLAPTPTAIPKFVASEEDFQQRLAYETSDLNELMPAQTQELSTPTEDVFTGMYPIEGLPILAPTPVAIPTFVAQDFEAMFADSELSCVPVPAPSMPTPVNHAMLHPLRIPTPQPNMSQPTSTTSVSGSTSGRPRDPNKPWVRITQNTNNSPRTSKIHQYKPEMWYHPVPAFNRNWSSGRFTFAFTPRGELMKPTYSASELRDYLYKRPPGNSVKLWIQRTPADAARRYLGPRSSKCRLADCPMQQCLT
ncbi:hypothetical protein LTR28_006638, partial [Elasticomyces elasticus]